MKPAIAVILAFLFVISGFADESSAAINQQSSKYAAHIVNADTGEVLYSRNADAKRYPASLTKMMTLYLTFEALRDGKLQLSQKIKVSSHAAAQPQTNIALRPGEMISVDNAIKALVVRSANDVAVVVAEALGGTDWRFAQMMTAKARQLGMQSTVYQNPNGLPDADQYTTARDLSRLSIALRRDFPQYYGYFKTPSFTWKNTTYPSHNRVMGRFEGADGLKTGYIGMSGFNLATSVTRDGYHIVAVVMGGASGRERDDHMVSLLGKTFTQLAERNDRPRAYAGKAPIPTDKPEIVTAVAEPESPEAVGQGDRIEPEDMPSVKNSPEIAKMMVATPVEKPVESAAKASAPLVTAAAQDTKEPEVKSVLVSATVSRAQEASPTTSKIVKAAFSAAPPMTLQYQMAKLDTGSRGTHAGFSLPNFAEKWGIQVGAYTDEQSAMQAAARAVELAREHLKDSKVQVSDMGNSATSIHRARLANLSESQAKQACERLISNNKQCFIYRADLQQNL